MRNIRLFMHEQRDDTGVVTCNPQPLAMTVVQGICDIIGCGKIIRYDKRIETLKSMWWSLDHLLLCTWNATIPRVKTITAAVSKMKLHFGVWAWKIHRWSTTPLALQIFGYVWMETLFSMIHVPSPISTDKKNGCKLCLGQTWTFSSRIFLRILQSCIPSWFSKITHYF